MNSSCATLKRMCKKKYSCEDKKNAIKYLCSTVWQREGTLLYENPNKEPGTYSGLQLFELPAENKHEDKECNHYVGYSLQGVPDATNEDLLGAGGTFFSTSIDGYNWSRLSYAANWNEEMGHFECKTTDLDDKSNYTFTLGMNKPTKISWRGYETNTIAVNPSNLVAGDSGFSGNGNYIALPHDSPSNYPSYDKVYSLAGWGGTTKKGDEYFINLLRTGPIVIKDDVSSESTNNSVITRNNDTSNINDIDIYNLITIEGLQNIMLELNYDNKTYYSTISIKYNEPLSVSINNNRQNGTCSLFYYDGGSDSIQLIKGTYLCRYSVIGNISQTKLNITCGDPINPIIDLTTSSLSTESNVKVVIKKCNIGLVLYEDINFNEYVKFSDAAAIELGFESGLDNDEKSPIKEAILESYPYLRNKKKSLIKGSKPLPTYNSGKSNYSNEKYWKNNAKSFKPEVMRGMPWPGAYNNRSRCDWLE